MHPVQQCWHDQAAGVADDTLLAQLQCRLLKISKQRMCSTTPVLLQHIDHEVCSPIQYFGMLFKATITNKLCCAMCNHLSRVLGQKHLHTIDPSVTKPITHLLRRHLRQLQINKLS
jgi:hypothetical protein